MGKEDYAKAVKLGKKDYQMRMLRGVKPTLQVLDDILPEKGTYAERPLGVVQIPIDLIVGTKNAGRSNSFSGNFMPILREGTEFASKWSGLSTSHIEEGIHTPIKAYEYMNKFYVEEGNKRVSVMKYFEADSIRGEVTRIIPKRTEDKENKIYFEFLDFYELAPINYIWFSQEGSFAKLQEAVGKEPGEKWSEDDIREFSFAYNRFATEFRSQGGSKLKATVGDAFLAFIMLYGFESISEKTTSELKELITKSWEEFELLQEEQGIELKMKPNKEKKSLLSALFSAPKLKIAFIYEKTPGTSAWTYAHELGRLYLEQTFPEELSIVSYECATQENIDELIDGAIAAGCNLIFTTTPSFVQASVKAAIANPDVRIMNCSLHTSHRYIRTYYSRMHEAKFLMGAIAGAMARNDKLAYIADYPIFGTIANINAFALGAKMINPRATVYLDWSAKKDNDALWNFKNSDASIISGKDMVIPEDASRYFGIFEMNDGYPKSLAMPVWQWGNFYEKLIRTIMEGTWKYDDDPSTTKAINYWWGMSADVVGVICSQNLPIGTKRLVELLKNTISRGEFNPFSGILYSQEGIVQAHPYRTLSPEAIMEMDWLAENVIGSIPKETELKEHTKAVVGQQGLDKAKG